jgi:hypothetical protein
VNNYSELVRGDIGKRALVAAFAHRGSAHKAAKCLRDEGFNKVWIGVTSAYVESDDRYNTGTIGTNVASADNSIGARLGRFFSDETDGMSLTDTLMRHGVSETEARRIDSTIEPDNALLTVEDNNHPELVARIVEDCGGDVLSGESFVETTIVEWSGADGLRGSQLLGYQDPTEYAHGQRVDGINVTRLRNEPFLNDTAPTLYEDTLIGRFDDE